MGEGGVVVEVSADGAGKEVGVVFVDPAEDGGVVGEQHAVDVGVEEVVGLDEVICEVYENRKLCIVVMSIVGLIPPCVYPPSFIMMNEVSGTLRPPDGHKAQIVRQEGDGGCLKRSDSPNR